MTKTQIPKLEELQSKAGTFISIVETLPYAIDPVEYFAKLSDFGRNKDCIMLESANIVPKYGERSVGSASPCLKIIGKRENFEINSLNETGKRFIEALDGDFDFCEEITHEATRISGKL